MPEQLSKISIEKRGGRWWVDCPCCARREWFPIHGQAVTFADSHAWREHRPRALILDLSGGQAALDEIRSVIDQLGIRTGRHLHAV